ncbi:MAG: 3'(2'),5'-bisphosphate nucleotidase [Anaerolineales bacterium]
MTFTQTPEVRFAIAAARQAALLVREIQAEMVTPALMKDDRSPVTIADFASQALVASLLAETFPNDPLVGEEGAAALRTPQEADTLAQITAFLTRRRPQATPEQVCDWIDRGATDSARRFWTLDPIDGTKGFLRGDQYAIAFALVVDGEVQIGALGCPNLRDGCTPDLNGPGSLLVAVRGQGTWMTALDGGETFTQLHVSTVSEPSQARILRSFESGHTNVSQIDVFAERLGIAAEPVRMDSQAKYAVLAAGGGEIYLRLLSPRMPDYREKIWDQAAGALVIEEAGGTVTDLHGKRLDFGQGRTLANNRGICATNTTLHPAALRALRDM